MNAGLAPASVTDTVKCLAEAGPDAETAARKVKNAVVGNPSNKRLYVTAGVIPPLLRAAAAHTQRPKLSVQALAALGSLAVNCVEGTRALVESRAVNVIVRALFSEHNIVVHAAARSLKVFTSAEDVPPEALDVAAEPHVVERLVLLIGEHYRSDDIAEVSAIILARICREQEHALAIQGKGGLPALIALLSGTSHQRCREAAVVALSALVKTLPSVAPELVRVKLVDMVFPLIRTSSDSLRLASCHLLTKLHIASAVRKSPVAQHILETAVVELVNLLSAQCQYTRVAAPHVLAELVVTSLELQRVATEEKACSLLSAYFPGMPPVELDCAQPAKRRHGSIVEASSSESSSGTPLFHFQVQKSPIGLESEFKKACEPIVEGALIALCSLCDRHDEAREEVIRLGLLEHIVDYMDSDSPQLVLAAVRCFRSLTRSVKVIRRDLSADKVSELLLKLLTSSSIEIQHCACAAVCNVVMDFSPVQPAFLARGGTSALVRLLKSPDKRLRLQALWGLKNLLFKADQEMKDKVMLELTYEGLAKICMDDSVDVRELAITMVRNLACSGSAQTETKHLDRLFSGMGDSLIEILAEALQPIPSTTEIAVQALYTVCNIASGSELHKAKLIESKIPQLILQWTSHSDEQARIAAVWCAINLSWKDTPASELSKAPVRLSRRRPGRQSLLAQQHLPLPSSELARNALEASVRNGPLHVVQTMFLGRLPEAPASEDTVMADDAKDDYNISAARSSHSNPRVGESERQNEGREKRTGYEWRIERLRELGFEGRLRHLVNDPHIEVQGRARAALELFSTTNPVGFNSSQPHARQHQRIMRRFPPPMVPRHGNLALGNGSDESSAGSNSDGSTVVNNPAN